jgi:hypothetical protein
MTERQRLVAAALLMLAVGVNDARAQQTIVFFRHGEKPAGGYGQLTCQGLNRALALPDVLNGKFGKPDFLYAPNPAVKISDPAGSFFYVRPLATIEPTAIRFGLSVNTNYGYADVAGLEGRLIMADKANTTIFVSWEHAYLVKVVQNIMNHHGGGTAVPPWIPNDYDTLYVVNVDYVGSTIHAQFHRDQEGLNNRLTTCP